MARDAASTCRKRCQGLRDEANEADGFAWVGLVEPTAEEFEAVTREFGLHELAVEDAVSAHQRPKLEVYDEALFLVLKTVRYLETEERVEIGEVMLFVGPDFLITVRHGEAGGLGNVREQLERQPELLAFGPGAATYAIVDRIVDAYDPVAEACARTSTRSRPRSSRPRGPSPVERIYRLHREVLKFGRATSPLRPTLRRTDRAGPPQHRRRSCSRTSATSPTTLRASATRWTASPRSSPASCRRR